jgi:ComF family protein
MSRWIKIKEGLRYLRIYLMAEKCLYCGDIMGLGHLALCERCESKLIPATDRVRSAADCPLLVAFEYTEEIRPVIHSLKYRKHKEAGMFLSGALVNACQVNGYGNFDLVLGVPCYKGRKNKRFCQGEYLANRVASLIGADTSTDILYKHRNVKSQTKCKSKSERRENVKDVYRVRANADVKGKSILLTDDVTTTGATMGECASALMKAGAASVVCVASTKPVNPEKQKIPIILGQGYYEFSESIDNKRD